MQPKDNCQLLYHVKCCLDRRKWGGDALIPEAFQRQKKNQQNYSLFTPKTLVLKQWRLVGLKFKLQYNSKSI